MKRSAFDKTLEEGARRLDIAPSKFEEAASHYEAVGNLLINAGLNVDIGPYGSIAMGTVTRPYTEDEDAFFDIDAQVVAVDMNKKDNTAVEVRNSVESILTDSKRYGDGDTLTLEDSCITINYVMDGEKGGFKLDLVPSVADANSPESLNCEYPHESDLAIAIARRESEEWLGSNPKGLVEWFLAKNKRFEDEIINEQKLSIQREYPTIYASVEDVPNIAARSSLQRSVQILKRSRDVYYTRCGALKKPSSCAITVLCAQIADEVDSTASISDILAKFAESIHPSLVID